ncbi:hypothetical protein C2G38_2173368 [Gigaspora rosea]|uniref:Uncharacterized protein n=1 Tax=Gigaspora rosea TaxID=44941 RepID=A0A397VJP4_9GLOM|nr:hypothetical protein C2G38_2173368 [Gigaspora rosea]
MLSKRTFKQTIIIKKELEKNRCAAKDRSFYASLRPQSTSQSTSQPVQPLQPQENLHIEMGASNDTQIITWREPTNSSEENNDNDTFSFMAFLEEVREDYLNGNPQLCAALNKFSMHPMIRVKGGVHIRVQPEFIKRRKVNGYGTKRKSHCSTNNGKENVDLQVIPARKKKKAGKKNHNLSESVSKNHPN